MTLHINGILFKNEQIVWKKVNQPFQSILERNSFRSTVEFAYLQLPY